MGRQASPEQALYLLLPRQNKLFTYYFDAEPVAYLWGARPIWLIALVRRIQRDAPYSYQIMPVLEGEQGHLKSDALKVLAPIASQQPRTDRA
jgi:predicted P-loop ATPase